MRNLYQASLIGYQSLELLSISKLDRIRKQLGNLRVTTLRAFGLDETRRVVDELK